ncbi:unnamed protein product [Caenorhabditis nigoni]
MGLIKPSRNGRDYCMECFAAEERRIQKTLYMKKRNENDKFEEVLRCSRCQKLWHRCCSFYLGSSNGFKFFQKQNGVDQMFFMLFVQEYKYTFVIDYLDSVKYVEADCRKRINQEIFFT